MNDRYEQFRQLERAASGRWADIIRALSCVDISAAITRRRHVRCHRDHGKTNLQFRVFRDFETTGGGVCNTCGPFANGFALLTYLNGWDYRRAVKEVAHYLEGRGLTGNLRPASVTTTRTWEVSDENLQRLQDIWNTTQCLTGTTGETYLRKRGIECGLPDDSEVRFHPRLHYWDNDSGRSLGHFPAIVSLVRSAQSGEPLTLHRTYLSSTGDKAGVPRPKKLMSAAIDGAISELGAAIRLFAVDGDCLAVTEGIETALAVRSAHPGLPVWACYSASVLTNFLPPVGVKRVFIWGDLDESGTGQAAAAKLAVRLARRSLEARILLPAEAPVFVNGTPHHGWYARDASRSDIVACLNANGYDVTNVPGPTLDWLDVWGASRQKVQHAIAGMRTHRTD